MAHIFDFSELEEVVTGISVGMNDDEDEEVTDEDEEVTDEDDKTEEGAE